MVDSEIKQWDEIKEDFQGADILLGNGFSINLYEGFNYTALFSSFLESLPEKQKEIYSRFDTANFESILKDLTRTKQINSLFGIEETKLDIAMNEIRNGLIQSITFGHPQTDQIDRPRIHKTEIALRFFSDVYTLNYDLFLYYIVLNAKKRFDKGEINSAYSDHFWGSHSKQFRSFNYPITDSRYSAVYYLHGAIFLFNNGFSAKKRIVKFPESNLLESITKEIISGEIPLFISEGNSEEKKRMIYQNDYLVRGFENFKSNTKNLVIYGASLSGADMHIVEAINNRMMKGIAVGLFLPNLSKLELESEMVRFKRLFKHNEPVFFNSSTLFN
ncbi:DUF4917 family protein [Ignavibacteriales bacterium]